MGSELERGPHAVLAVMSERERDDWHTVRGRTMTGLEIGISGADFELVKEVAAHLFNAMEELRPSPPKEGMN